MTPTDWNGEEISDWAHHQFGPQSAMSIALRMNKEMPELLLALYNGELEHVRDEIADLAIFLLQIIHVTGLDLQTIVNDKMDINVQREWEIKNDGSFQHVA